MEIAGVRAALPVGWVGLAALGITVAVADGASVALGAVVVVAAGATAGAQALKAIANNITNRIVFIVILVALLRGWTWRSNKLNKRLINIFSSLILGLSCLGMIFLDLCALSIRRYSISIKKHAISCQVDNLGKLTPEFTDCVLY
jgi:hypothetical protein